MSATEAEPEDKQKVARDRKLVLAAGKGDYAGVNDLLRLGVDVDARAPPLLGKFNNGKSEVMEVCRDQMRVRTVRPTGNFGGSEIPFMRTALQAAADGGHHEVVKLLIDTGADVNAPPARSAGRTALQIAVEGGHHEMVKLLIGAGADVNAPKGENAGITALQAAVEGGNHEILKLLIVAGGDVNELLESVIEGEALQVLAGGGHHEIVRLLVDSGADVNAPPAENTGRTALQAAVGGGHHGVAKLLIDARAKVNAPPSTITCRTALQEAAEGGNQPMVMLLIEAGADINAPPAESDGRTALQAAAGSGHHEVVRLLIDAGADVNAPPAGNSGMMALQAAAEGGHQEAVMLLIDAGSEAKATPEIGDCTGAECCNREDSKFLIESYGSAHRRDHLGQTILHKKCKAGNAKELSLLLRLETFDLDAKDYLGSTPLHTAVREKQESVLKVLMRGGANMNIKDNSGKTPLQVALDNGYRKIMNLLLQNGARTDGLTVDRFLRRTRHAADTSNRGALILQGALNQQKSLKETGRGTTKIDLRHEKWALPSICLLGSQLGIDHSGDTESFVDPRTYLEAYHSSYPDHTSSGAIVQWAWLTASCNRDGGGSRNISEFVMGVPTSSDVQLLRPADVILVAYICFDIPHDSGAGTSSFQDVRSSTAMGPFQFTARKIEISWVMNNSGTKQGFLKSMHYRGTLNLKYLSIPNNSVEFVLLLLKEVHGSWLEFLWNARLYQAKRHDSQLSGGGKNPHIIEYLLNDSQQWNKLRTYMQLHLSKLKELLDTYIGSEALCKELYTDDDQEADNTYVEFMENLKVVKELSTNIGVFGDECGNAIFDFQKETKEMIELEFNLVSIYEARKSISMSEVSLSMSVSMKRLSWITFIFLPLSFVSGLFGMNVSLLVSNPSWLWYLAFAVPLLSLVILVWILFKYINISAWIEKNIGSPLESMLNKSNPNPTSPGETPRKSGFADSGKLDSSIPATTNLLSTGRASPGQLGVPFVTTLANWLRRRQKRRLRDEEAGLAI